MKGDREQIERKCAELGFELLDKEFDYNRNRDKTFNVRCLKCGKISRKSYVTLVKGNHGCRYCHENNVNYHNSLTEVIPKIKQACNECNYTFIGFDGEWSGCRNTKLILKCNKCGKITNKNYDNLVNKKSKCVCYKYKKLYDANVLSIEKVYRKIDLVCKRNNFTFIRFLSHDGKYHNNKTVLEVKCNKCNESLKYDFNHFTDRKLIKCKHCEKSILESYLEKKLLNDNIEFESQKKFEWLKYKNKLSLDFYLPQYKIGIECQGIQHYEPIDFFGGEKSFKEQIKRDEIKLKLCEEHNIKLIYVRDNKEIDSIQVK